MSHVTNMLIPCYHWGLPQQNQVWIRQPLQEVLRTPNTILRLRPVCGRQQTDGA
jgi:hypothetical protein